MTGERFVDAIECALCKAIADAADTTELFAHGYIAGRSAVSAGMNAAERFCSKHAQAIADAKKAHIGKGVRPRRT
jgi:hypothetical protein